MKSSKHEKVRIFGKKQLVTYILLTLRDSRFPGKAKKGTLNYKIKVHYLVLMNDIPGVYKNRTVLLKVRRGT